MADEDGLSHDGLGAEQTVPSKMLGPQSNDMSNQYTMPLPATAQDTFPVYQYYPLSDDLVFREPSGSSIVEPDSVLGESGRFYHGYHEGKYFLPNDAAEQDRLDMQHAAITLLMGDRLFLAPLAKVPDDVLDVATGTGIWALEFAKQFPTANVVGSDLSAIQPKDAAPSNCTFMKDDADQPWLYDRTFDLIHLRFVCSCFDDHKTIMKQAFDNLNPGGWIEYQDFFADAGCANGSMEGSALGKWGEYCSRGGMALAGHDVYRTAFYKQWLLKTGFVDVVQIKTIVPLNPWSTDARLKKVGHFMMVSLCEGIRGVGWKGIRAAGLSVEEAEQYFLDLKTELKETKHHWYFPFYVVYGRKPFPGEIST